MHQKVTILSSAQLDRTRWDACIRTSTNPVIYAYSWYLDHLADHWHGIVYGDYAAVMPVPWRKKMGIRYCYQVPFIQQLGWFAGAGFMAEGPMLQALHGFCRYGDYAFNYGNVPRMQQASLHANFILRLSVDYATLSNGFNTDLQHNLKKAAKGQYQYKPMDIATATALYRHLYASRTPHVVSADYLHFQQLCSSLETTGAAFARCIMDKAGEVLAAAVLLLQDNRLYNMMNSTPDPGRKTGANHLLFDQVIREFAGTGIVLDFEGSDITGIRLFYEKFGSVNEPYCSIHINHLPFPLRLLKR